MRPTAMVLLALLAPGCLGERGDPGPPGPPGSTDTEAQVLEKVNQALAAGGSLDLRRSAVAAAIAEEFTVPGDTPVKVPYSTIDLPFSNVAYDKLGELDSAQSQFTAARTGEYLVCASLAPSQYIVTWRLSTFINRTLDKTFAGDARVDSGCVQTHLDASDVLDVLVFQWSSSDQLFVAGTNWCWLRIHRIG